MEIREYFEQLNRKSTPMHACHYTISMLACISIRILQALHTFLFENKIAQQNHTKNITKKPFHCDSYILKIITRHSLINTHHYKY